MHRYKNIKINFDILNHQDIVFKTSDSWIKQINYCLDIFASQSLIQPFTLDKVLLSDNSVFTKNKVAIEQLARNFVYRLKLVNNQHVGMLINFFSYLLYQLAYKQHQHKVKTLFLHSNFYSKENELALNSIKRKHYYHFLDQYKNLPNYNDYLIQLLRKVL
ncbi:hypothetical protein ACJA23_02445 [Mycoplasma corogypsi]|uniref:hypothetical protein n=1 Tax=Mycoplasma corogypsi TaxID=2106 RepID=UPI003872B648